MKISSEKENILKKIRQALSHSTPIPFPQSEGAAPVFRPITEELAIAFAEKFVQLDGRFVFCASRQELIAELYAIIAHNNWHHLFCREDKLLGLLSDGSGLIGAWDLDSCDAAITSCELLIARTGSIVMSTAQQSGRTASVYAPVHLCIAYTEQLVEDIRDALLLLKEKYAERLPSLITLATGPSRTADIEKTLVVGVHGPKEVYVFLVDEPA